MLFVALIVCVILMLIFRSKSDKDLEKVAVAPGKLPIIGHSYFFATVKDSIFEDVVVKLGNFAIENGDVCKVFVMSHPVYGITDPEDALTIMNKCLKKMPLYKLITPLFGTQLLAAEVPVWKRNRRQVELAFKQNVLDEYFDFFNMQAKVLSDTFEQEAGKGEVDLSKIILRNVLETTCHTTMGSSSSEISVKEEYVHAIHTVFKILVKKILNPWLIIDFIFNMTRNSKDFYDGINTVIQHSERMVKLRQEEYANRVKNGEYLEPTGPKFRSCLEILIENNAGPNGFSMKDHEFRNLADNIMIAGFDTTTYELLFILVCIGTSSDVQDKIYQEILSVLGDEEVTKEHLQHFVYLEAAIKEALRLYPIGPIIAREADEDVQLTKVTVPKGSSIALNLYSINRHKRHWGADAEEFRPDRWLDPAGVPDHPAAFCSFAPGRRGCPGKQYAMMYFKITLIAILRKFKLTSDHKKMKLSLYLMLKPESGHLIELNLR